MNTPDTVYQINWVGNYHQKGPSTRDDLRALVFQVKNGKEVQIYEKGNWVNGQDPGHPNRDVYLERVRVTWRDEPWPVAPKYQVTVEDSMSALEKALSNADATVPCRDTLDQRYIQDMRRGKGKVLDEPGATVMDSRDVNGHRGYPSLAAGTAPLDTDRDGMPDQWETDNGFDTRKPDNNGDKDGDEYTNLEEYKTGSQIETGGAKEHPTSRSSGQQIAASVDLNCCSSTQERMRTSLPPRKQGRQ